MQYTQKDFKVGSIYLIHRHNGLITGHLDGLIQVSSVGPEGFEYNFIACKQWTLMPREYVASYSGLNEAPTFRIREVPLKDLPLYLGWYLNDHFTKLIKGDTNDAHG